MKNLFLRVKRNFDSNSNNFAPEYADLHLDVEFSAPKGLEGVKEVSVRIYSASYRLMGVGCTEHDAERTFRKACFDMANDDLWDAGLYRAYVYINGTPKWFCELDLPVSSEYWTRKGLESMDGHPLEMFFADKLAMTNWWPKLHCGRFKEPFIRMLTEKLMIFSNDMEEKRAAKVPHLLVTGEDENSGTKAMASMILGGFITNDDVTKKYYLSLSEITTGAYGWKNMEKKVAKSKAAIIEVSDLDYNAHTVNIVNLMASMIRYDTFSGTTFVLHGTDRNIDMMMEKCILMQGLFSDRTTLRLSSDRSVGVKYEYDEEEDEFMKAVGELLDKENRRGLEETENRTGYCKAENPGTGKTTVAKLVGQMYHSMGLLSKGHTVETNRSKLVGEYIGTTEKKTLDAIEEARGGVLFIDEAYTLISHESDTKDFGKEVLNALLTVLSEPEPDMIIILAGYEDKMAAMMKTNPGLKDRFPLTFHFDDYSAGELMEMACRTLEAGNYRLTDEAHRCLASLIEKAAAQRDEYFGNGRWVHNLINQGIIKSMARRVMSGSAAVKNIDISLLCDIQEADIIEAERNFLNLKTSRISSPRPIGFRA